MESTGHHSGHASLRFTEAGAILPTLNLAALYDALNCASLAALLSEEADPRRAAKAGEALLEASLAAASAFPAGSTEAQALNVILGAIEGAMASGVTA